MVNKKTLPKQKKSIKNTQRVLKSDSGIMSYSPVDEILDESFIGKAIVECLKNNDPKGVVEIIGIYLDAVNKVRAAQKANLSRSTLYHSLKGKNPTLKTLAKLMHASDLDLRK